MARGWGARLGRLEREWREGRERGVAATLRSVYFQGRFGGGEPVIRKQSEAFVDLFAGRKRVLDLGSGRGIFLQLLKDKGIGGGPGALPPRRATARPRQGPAGAGAGARSHARRL